MTPTTKLGLRFIFVLKSSKYLTSPPMPEGILTCSAMIVLWNKGIKMFLNQENITM